MGGRESIQDEEIAQGGLWQSEAGDWMDHALVKVILDIFSFFTARNGGKCGRNESRNFSCPQDPSPAILDSAHSSQARPWKLLNLEGGTLSAPKLSDRRVVLTRISGTADK